MIIDEIKKYVSDKGYSLSEQSEALLGDVVALFRDMNRDVFPWLFLIPLIDNVDELRSLMHRKGCDPQRAKLACMDRINVGVHDDPFFELNRYEELGLTIGNNFRIDTGIAAAYVDGRNEIYPRDFLAGLLDEHDESYPSIENSEWSDEALHVSYNTLSHIIGKYEENLWIKSDDVRKELNLEEPNLIRRKIVESAPIRLKTSLLDLFSDWPDYSKNCFLIMPFANTKPHKEVHVALVNILKEKGFNLLRADDRNYSDDVLANIETYIHGSKFALSVHERVQDDSHSANVALEIGYFLGQRKDVCQIKENTVRSLPSDLQGKLYVSFDISDIQSSLSAALVGWLSDKRLIKE